jgi:glutathione S-transferase
MSALPSITLFQPPTRPWGMPNLSPFCAKLECYLRLAKIPHAVAPADMRQSPKGKMPYVRIGDELMGDSQLVIERLESLRTPPMDAWLSAEQRAVGHMTRRALEEGFYFVVMSERWNTDITNTVQRQEFTKVLPGPLKLAFPLIVRDVRKKLRGQGTGRHTREEITRMGAADMSALSTLLADKRYLLGDKPSTFDATAFAFVSSVLGYPAPTALKAHTSALSNVAAYHDRMKSELFSDLTA